MALTKVEAEQLQAAQTNITSVGTLTSLTVSGALNGTLSTAAQPNITSVGTLTGLTVSGAASFSSNITAASGVLNIGIGTSAGGVATFFGTGTGAEAKVQIEGEGGADPYINFLANNTQHWSVGIDDSDSDKLKISKHSALGTNDYFTLDTSGSVGIGNTIPSSFVESSRFVVGSGTSGLNEMMFLYSGTNTFGAIGFADGTTGVARYMGIIGYHHSDNELFFSTNGGGEAARSMTISSAGNVGIGTTDPQRALQIGTYGTGNGEIAIASSTTGFGSILFGDSASGTALYDGYLQYQHDDRELLLGAGAIVGAKINSSGDLTVTGDLTVDTTTLKVDSTNNRVGIGISNPDSILHVRTAVNNTARLILESTAANSYPYLTFKNDAREYGIYGAHGTLNSGDDAFTIYDNTAGAHRLTIIGNGNVGIRQTNPSENLHISSDVSGDHTRVHITKTSTAGTAGVSMRSKDSSNTWTIFSEDASASDLYFYDGTDYVMTLDSANNRAGIGTTSPFSKLQVGSNTFSGSNGMYSDSRVGISNHGFLTGLMLASTYNDGTYPEYGLVFVQGPSTSSYNCWSISPDGPAKGNRLNFHYQAQSTNIHVAPRMASLDGSGNFYPAGDVVMAQGKGIQFVNQTDFATGETVKSSILDDYEEGTFVPTIGGSSTQGSFSGTTANGGFYIKVGRMVQVWINATGSLSGASGYMRVYGLPFVCASNIADHGKNAVYSTGSLQYWSGSGADVMGPLNYPNTSYLYFHTYNGSSTGGQPSVFNGTHNLHCCATYYTS